MSDFRGRVLAKAGLLIGFGLMAAGCAANHDPMVSRIGVFPQAGTFTVAAGDDAANTEWSQLLSERLPGWQYAPGETPRYVVQIARAERPANVDLIIPAQDGAERRPVRRDARFDRRYLDVTVSDIRTGLELYRISASQRSEGTAEQAWLDLLDAGLAVPPGV